MEFQPLSPESCSGLSAGSSARDSRRRRAQAECSLLLCGEAWRDCEPWRHKDDRGLRDGGLSADAVDCDCVGHLYADSDEGFGPEIQDITACGFGLVSCGGRGLRASLRCGVCVYEACERPDLSGGAVLLARAVRAGWELQRTSDAYWLGDGMK